MLSDDIILRMAMLNSYDIVTGIVTQEELIETDLGYFIFDPSVGYNVSDLDLMIAYFEDNEEYEKCQKIKEIQEII